MVVCKDEIFIRTENITFRGRKEQVERIIKTVPHLKDVIKAGLRAEGVPIE